MGLTQYKRRRVRKHLRTLRTCGGCPITLLCFTGRIPSGVTICRCSCGLVYPTTNTDPGLIPVPVNLFKPFRCTQPVTNLKTGYVQLLSGVEAFPRRCGECSRLSLCAVCGKHMKPYETTLTTKGQCVHWRCSDWLYSQSVGVKP